MIVKTMQPDRTPLTRSRRGFTITELLVVVALILILVSLLVVVTERVYARATQVECQARLEQIYLAVQMYANEHRGMLPRTWDMYSRRRWYETLADGYLDRLDVIACPAASAVGSQTAAVGDPVPTELSKPILDALKWLKNAQETDGRWEPGNWGGNRTSSDCGVTGLALMAFIGYGCTDQYPEEFAPTVAKGIDWLVSRQEASGKFPGHGGYWPYDHHVSTMALSLAYKATGRAGTKQAAQKGVTYTVSQEHPDHGGFGYDGNKNDASVTGWALQAIWAADLAGLNVDKSLVAKCLQTMVYNSPGSANDYSCWYRYSAPYRFDTGNHRHQAATAISLTSRLLMGHTVGSTPSHSSNAGRCRGVLNWLLNDPYYYSYARTSTHLLYYYYYMTLANSLLGGEQWENWTTVQPGGAQPIFPNELADLQQLDGHWPTSICTWGGYGSKVYTTALACLALEAALEGHWGEEEVSGACSYGYNDTLGADLFSPSRSTILIADAMHWMIGPEDDPSRLAPRHSGKINILFADGTVRPLSPDEVTDEMWTSGPAE